MKLTEELLRQAVWESINNALSLRESAVLLAENGKAPAAAALAIIGEEEFAKAIVFTVAAAVPEQRPVLAARLRDLSAHNVKHLFTSVVDGAQIVNSEGWAIARQEGYPVSAEEKLTDLFGTLASSGIDGLITTREEARTFYADMLKNSGLPWREQMLPSDPSKLKEVALYVDIVDGELSTPDRIGGRHAESQIRVLEYFLAHFQALPSVLEDDERWANFSARLRRASKPEEK